MKKFSVITFSDCELKEDNLLRKSCTDLGLQLEVLLHTPWVQNSIKLKLLYEFLERAEPDQLLLVVDALDVILFDDARTIEERFSSFNVDLLFSAESNYMFKDPKLWLHYFRRYPKQQTIYNFLNSGSYMGSAASIRAMLETIQADYDVSLSSEEEVLSIRSDQYLLHRFYVDNFHRKGEKQKLALDAQQLLLGCTGGRFCIRKFPDHSKTQAFVYFQIERNLVKLLKLHKYQSRAKDYEVRSGRFHNTKTGTSPSVIHLPGTWGNFTKMVDRLFSKKQEGHPLSVKKILAQVVSYFSYLASVPISWGVKGVKAVLRLI